MWTTPLAWMASRIDRSSDTRAAVRLRIGHGEGETLAVDALDRQRKRVDAPDEAGIPDNPWSQR